MLVGTVKLYFSKAFLLTCNSKTIFFLVLCFTFVLMTLAILAKNAHDAKYWWGLLTVQRRTQFSAGLYDMLYTGVRDEFLEW